MFGSAYVFLKQSLCEIWVYPSRNKFKFQKKKKITEKSKKITDKSKKITDKSKKNHKEIQKTNNLGGERRGPSTRAPPGNLAGKRFQSDGVLLFWSDLCVTIIILTTPVKSKYILKDSRRPVKEELSCGQRVEVTEGEDIRWNRISGYQDIGISAESGSNFFDGRSQIPFLNVFWMTYLYIRYLVIHIWYT